MTWKHEIARMGAAAAMVALASVSAHAQAPGVPVLQNAFANPGLAFAANFGTGGGQSFFGAAAGWGLSGGRMLLSAAAGGQRTNEATRGAYGARAAVIAWTSRGGAIGLGAFAGIGGAPRTRNDSATTNAAVMNIPVGLSVGYRRALGATRGFSIFGSPLYRWSRVEANGVTASSGNVGGSVGVDFAVSQSIGVTVGGEFGKRSESITGGPSSTFGFAVSFVPGR
jgi:hypothetical protein